MFTAHDPENMVKNHASASHITALYISRSGAIGIQTEDPKVIQVDFSQWDNIMQQFIKN
jgi:hypothetical protein